MKRKRTYLILVVALCLMVILLWTSQHPPPPPSNDVLLLTQDNLSPNRPPAVSGRTLPLRPPCLRNQSMVNVTGFSDLPVRLQNFLYYQHCKHFPLLLDLPHKCGRTDTLSLHDALPISSGKPGLRSGSTTGPGSTGSSSRGHRALTCRSRG